MIKTLSIRNHRSIRKLDIELDPHVNTICGESWRGKSNLVRAIKWVLLNRPSGTRFIRWGSKSCKVSTTVGQEKITRVRSKSRNTYTLNGRKLHAFGNDVPNDIRRMLRLDDINFQTQQEMPHGSGPLFWFALTAGQVGKRLNKIVNLDTIDRTMKNIQQKLTQTKAALTVCDERLMDAQTRCESLSFVPSLNKEWKRGVEFENDLVQQRERFADFTHLVESILHFQGLRNEWTAMAKQIESDLIKMEDLRKTIIQETNRVDSLSLLILNANRQSERSEVCKTELTEAEQSYKKAFGNRCPLCGSKTKITL